MSEEKEIKIFCPHCNAKIAVPEDFIGEEVLCPKCNNAFTVTAPAAAPTAPAAAPTAPAAAPTAPAAAPTAPAEPLELRTKELAPSLKKTPKPAAETAAKPATANWRNAANADFALKGGTRRAAPVPPPVNRPAQPAAAAPAAAPAENPAPTPAAAPAAAPADSAETIPTLSSMKLPEMKFPPALPPKTLRSDPDFCKKKRLLIGILTLSGVFLLILLLCIVL